MTLPKPVKIAIGILLFLFPVILLVGLTNWNETAPLLNWIVAPISCGFATMFWAGANVKDVGQSDAKNTTKWIFWGVIIGIAYAIMLTVGK